jgi:hypothetical protein
MRIRLITAAVMVTGITAACSSSGGSGGSGIPTVQQAAAMMGATGVHPYGPAKGGASAYADAIYQGKSVTIATFATKDLEDGWLSLAGIATPVVYRGNLFAAILNPASR